MGTNILFVNLKTYQQFVDLPSGYDNSSPWKDPPIL